MHALGFTVISQIYKENHFSQDPNALVQSTNCVCFASKQSSDYVITCNLIIFPYILSFVMVKSCGNLVVEPDFVVSKNQQKLGCKLFFT